MMKRNLTCFALFLALVLVFSCPVFAAAEGGYITDLAGLLTNSEAEALEQKAEELAYAYDCGVYIITVEDHRDYAYDVYDAATMIYEENDLGVGNGKDGLLLLLSMAERDYSLIVYGEDSHYAFTDYGRGEIEDAFLDDFAVDDWNSGMEDYLSTAEELLVLAEEGTPLEKGTSPLTVLLFVVLIPLGITAIICLVQRSKMKTAREKSTAREYVAPDGVSFRVRTDRFTHVTRSRVKVASSSNSSSRSGGGFSGSKGKF